MASLKDTANHPVIVLGKESTEAVKHFNRFFSGTGIEVSSENELPLTSHLSHCTLVVLDSESQSMDKLGSLLTQGSNKKVILNLEDLNLAKLSSEVPHELFWFASKDPVSLLGILLDRFQGAYWRDSEVVVSKENSFELFGLIGNSPMNAQQKKSLLVSVLVARLFGIEERQVQKRLETLLLNESGDSKKNETKIRQTEAV